MNLSQLSKRERFYFDVGEALSTNNSRCFIDQQTLEMKIHPGEDGYTITDEEDSAKEALDNPDKYLPIEPVSSHAAFRVMSAFTEAVENRNMQQRLSDALNGRKPFANFNHLVHTTNVRELWFDLKNKAYTEMAKE